MANTPISGFSSGAPAQSGDELVIARSGANYKLTNDDIRSLFVSTANSFTTSQNVTPLTDVISLALRRNGAAQTSNIFEIQTEANAFLAGFDKAGLLTLGAATRQTGTLKLAGTTSGTVSLSVADAAGTWTMKLPNSGGANGYLLTTDGSGNTSWTNPTALGIDLDIGSTAITSGTATRILFEGSGNVLQESASLTWNDTTKLLTATGLGTGGGANTGGLTVSGGSMTLSGNISANAWTTSGIRYKSVAATLTDLTSTGTVAAAYTNVYGGNTIAASNSTTFTDYFTTYISEPSAGTNVTLTNKWAAGFGGNVKVTGALTLGTALSAANGGTGLTALGTGVATALGNATNSSGGLLTQLTVNSTATSGGAAGQIMYDDGSKLQESSVLVFSSPSLNIVSNTATLKFGTSSDVILARDAANTLALRNSTNAQTFNVYNTYTDASNYERGVFKWSSNILTIGTENAGTGTARNIAITGGRLSVGTTASDYNDTSTSNTAFMVSPYAGKYQGIDGAATSQSWNFIQDNSASSRTRFANVNGLMTATTAGAESGVLRFGTRNTTDAGAIIRWRISEAGHFLGETDNTYDIGASGATRPRNVYVGTKITQGSPSALAIATSSTILSGGSNPNLVIENSATNSGSTSAGIIMYQNDGTAVTSGTRLAQWIIGGQTGGAGNLRNTAALFAYASQNWVDGSAQGTRFEFATTANSTATRSTKLILGNSGILTFGATEANTVPALKPSSAVLQARLGDDSAYAQFDAGTLTLQTDVILARDAADTLALRNGANAQRFNIYNTYTDAANYERASIYWSGNTFIIQTGQALGSGTVRDCQIRHQNLNFAPGSTTAWTFTSAGNLIAVDNTYDIGAATATRPRNIYAATSIRATGSTAVIGYGTGAGGAVTQATSRTTGVTLNKGCGQITLVSAAGSTSWQSFTVTNSTVAATDTIIVNQDSGTDLYQIFVTNVAAGSFAITFATTGGTTTEQPVFSFAVLKAVAA